MLASVATSDEKNPLVDVLFVVDPLVTVRLVPVAEPNESTVVVADDAKRLVEVLFVATRLVNTVDEANTIPVFEIPKSVVPEDDATLRRERLDVDVARIVKRYEDEVALIPVNTPLSISVEVPRVVEVSQRVA